MYTYEIYFESSYVKKESWNNLIKILSDYNGILKTFKIIIKIEDIKIRYFIKTKVRVPITFNNLKEFIFKEIEPFNMPKYDYALIKHHNMYSNIVDLINYYNIKKNEKLLCLELTFTKIYEDKIIKKINIYVLKNSFIKYIIPLSIPSYMLSVDFNVLRKYTYNKVQKYLDINKSVNMFTTDKVNSICKINAFPYLQGSFYLNTNNFDFAKHSLIIGSSGSGKSKLISLLVNNINKERYKVVVLDPHASLEKDIGALGRVIDFETKEDSINLFINNKENIASEVEIIVSLFKTLMQDTYNSKLERVLRHSIYLLIMTDSFNFKNLRKLLLDIEYRNNLIKENKFILPDSVINFFLGDYNELKTKSYSEAISPILSMLDETELVKALNEDGLDDLEKTIKENFLTIFSLDRTKLGSSMTKIIAGLIMNELMVIMEKGLINEHIIFIIDEVSTIENELIPRMLSESRKYNLSLILAGQYFNGISEKLKSSIFANTVNYFIFRVSREDAVSLSKNIDMKIIGSNNEEDKIKMLTDLNDRECIMRLSKNGLLYKAFKGKTTNYISRPRIKKEGIIKNNNNLNKNKLKFSIDDGINLNDILRKTSTGRKVI